MFRKHFMLRSFMFLRFSERLLTPRYTQSGNDENFTTLLQVKNNFVFICILPSRQNCVKCVFHPPINIGAIDILLLVPLRRSTCEKRFTPFQPKWLWQASFRVRIHVSHDTSTHTSIHPHTWSSSESREITITMKIDLLKSESKKGDAKGTVRKLEGG